MTKPSLKSIRLLLFLTIVGILVVLFFPIKQEMHIAGTAEVRDQEENDLGPCTVQADIRVLKSLCRRYRDELTVTFEDQQIPVLENDNMAAYCEAPGVKFWSLLYYDPDINRFDSLSLTYYDYTGTVPEYKIVWKDREYRLKEFTVS